MPTLIVVVAASTILPAIIFLFRNIDLLNKNSGAAIVLLTGALLLITAYYAVETRNIRTSDAKMRLRSVRPVIFTKVSNLAFSKKQVPDDEEKIEFDFDVYCFNATAINVDFSYDAPFKFDPTLKQYEYVQCSRSGSSGPQILEHNKQWSARWNFPSCELPKIGNNEIAVYLIFNIRYEDIDQNYYEQTTFYKLNDIGHTKGKPHIYAASAFEEVQMVPFQKRRYKSRHYLGPEQQDTIYRSD